MPAAFALGMNSGKIILTEQCRAVCGPPGIAFSQMELGRQGAAAAPASYGSGGAAGGRASPLSRALLGSSPKGRALGMAARFPVSPEPLPLGEVSPQVTERVPSREKVDRENPQIFPIYKL